MEGMATFSQLLIAAFAPLPIGTTGSGSVTRAARDLRACPTELAENWIAPTAPTPCS